MSQTHNLCSFVLHRMAGAESSFSQLQIFFDTLLFGCTIIWERLSMLGKISPVTERLYEIINNTPRNDGVLACSRREKTRTHKFKPCRQIPPEVHTRLLLLFSFPACLLLETLLHTVQITSNSISLFEKQHLMLCCERSVNLFAPRNHILKSFLRYDLQKMLGTNIFPIVVKSSCINLSSALVSHT